VIESADAGRLRSVRQAFQALWQLRRLPWAFFHNLVGLRRADFYSRIALLVVLKRAWEPKEGCGGKRSYRMRIVETPGTHRRYRCDGTQSHFGHCAIDFAAVFFAPAALITAVIALIRRQIGWGVAGLLLGLLGLAGIAYTSQQIFDIFNGGAGRTSLSQPTFAPPPIVTRKKYD
jgi:hypothetical protein